MPTLKTSISGIRGIIGDGLDIRAVVDYTAAFACLFPKKAKVLVARDTRITGESILNAVASTLMASGINVIDIGIYPLNYTWDKNIFNQLCIPKYIENSNLNYNEIDERMKDFVTTMKINATADKIEKIDEKNIQEKVVKNDITIATSFTEYFHTVFWISM